MGEKEKRERETALKFVITRTRLAKRIREREKVLRMTNDQFDFKLDLLREILSWFDKDADELKPEEYQPICPECQLESHKLPWKDRRGVLHTQVRGKTLCGIYT